MPYIDADEEQEIDTAFNKIDTQRAKIKRLTDALRGLVLVCGTTGDSLADFEEQAEAFHRETGWMRPGKDISMASGDESTHEERRIKYSAWVQMKIETARKLLGVNG